MSLLFKQYIIGIFCKQPQLDTQNKYALTNQVDSLKQVISNYGTVTGQCCLEELVESASEGFQMKWLS